MRVAIFFILLLGSVGAMVPSVEEVTSGMEIESGGAKIYCALEGCQREMEKESLIFAKCPDHIACERCARHFICSEKLNAPHRFVERPSVPPDALEAPARRGNLVWIIAYHPTSQNHIP
ncbi:hypothetical protein PCASD_06625 [Puccinia coronata f. sp. avenae]|uniref:CxC6 like cysteine cluster associated with KDZ domain-containing protein n=1 Tax=Puccinia coronata f. sp. avenae TaxID=200324 RepID=A0A2N5UT88_9BASI|nr:hypothetical protein PCASD_06625 [Puccinia coronata f. sp. avenae]